MIVKRGIAATVVVALLALPAMAQSRDVVPISPAGIDAKPQGGNWLFGTCPVYQNSTSPLGFLLIGNNRERGDGVTLAGINRRVTNITLMIHSNAPAGHAADVRVRFYEGGDTGPDPGALLWESDVVPQMNIPFGTAEYDFPVPNVLVPDDFTWTLELANTAVSPPAVGSSFLDPPTLGSSQNWIWDNNGGVWARRTFAVGGDNNLGAIIDACNPCDPCDMNCDGVVDATDIESFINILFNGATPCNFCTGDTNGDRMVDAEDIEGFIACLFP